MRLFDITLVLGLVLGSGTSFHPDWRCDLIAYTQPMLRYVLRRRAFQVPRSHLVSPPTQTLLISSPRPLLLCRPLARHIFLFQLRFFLIPITKPDYYHLRLRIHPKSPINTTGLLIKELSYLNLRGMVVSGIPRRMVWRYSTWTGGMGEYTESSGVEEFTSEI